MDLRIGKSEAHRCPLNRAGKVPQAYIRMAEGGMASGANDSRYRDIRLNVYLKFESVRTLILSR